MIPQNIILKKGLENIKFGISENELLYLIGLPDEIIEEEFIEGDPVRIFKYYDILFSFSEINSFKLSEIEFTSSQYVIADITLVGKTLQVFLDEMQELEIESPKIEVQINEYTDNTIFLFYESIGLTAIFEDYLCKSVSIYPIYDEEDKIIWPN
jgi:hypothetical protein